MFLAIVLLLALAPPLCGAQSPTAMVRVPAGAFLMGSNDGPEDERPQHSVTLAEFFIDRTPVTNRQFAEFLDALGPRGTQGEKYYDIDDNDARVHRVGGKWRADAGHENHPVVETSWFGALAFCRWAGKRLPTEAEWEKPRAAATVVSIPGATKRLIARALTSAPVGTICGRWTARRRAPAPTEYSIWRAMGGSG